MLKLITLLFLSVCIAVIVGDVPESYLRPAYNSGPMKTLDECQRPTGGQCIGGPNDNFTTCGTACPRVCGQIESTICTFDCITNVCECGEDYFRRLSDCQCVPKKKCYGKPPNKPEKLPYICTLPTESGPCYAMLQRWAYNPSTKRCEQFTYGGCEGNPNNFKAKSDCEQCCPKNTLDVCPKVNIRLCETSVNRLSGQCLGGSHDKYINSTGSDCGSDCPLICNEKPPEVCTERCVIDICQCEKGYERRLSDCRCVLQPDCNQYGYGSGYDSGQWDGWGKPETNSDHGPGHWGGGGKPESGFGYKPGYGSGQWNGWGKLGDEKPSKMINFYLNKMNP